MELKWSEEMPGRTDWELNEYGTEWRCRSKICNAYVLVAKVYSKHGINWMVSWAAPLGDEEVSLNIHGVLFDTAEEAKTMVEQTIIPGPARDKTLAEIDAAREQRRAKEAEHAG